MRLYAVYALIMNGIGSNNIYALVCDMCLITREYGVCVRYSLSSSIRNRSSKKEGSA